MPQTKDGWICFNCGAGIPEVDEARAIARRLRKALMQCPTGWLDDLDLLAEFDAVAAKWESA